MSEVLIGKTITRVFQLSSEIVLEFNDGTKALIQAEAGMGYNEGLAWIECKITAPNAEEDKSC